MITRENYREYDAINYSTLSALNTHPKQVKEKKYSEGIRYGSMLDTLCFDGEDIFHNEYYVSTLDNKDIPSDNIKAVIHGSDLSDEGILQTAKKINYGQSWNSETILNKVKVGGEKYISFLEESKGKDIISLEMFADLSRAVELLKTSPNTSKFFQDADFQRPLTTDLLIEGDIKASFKCLCDIYAEDNYEIIVADLKFTSGSLKAFRDYAFLKWRYDLQASIYSTIPGNITKKPVSFYNLVYSGSDNAVFAFKVDNETLYCGANGGVTNRGKRYKGYKELAKEYIWHQQHDIWSLPYEFCVNSELIINPYE